VGWGPNVFGKFLGRNPQSVADDEQAFLDIRNAWSTLLIDPTQLEIESALEEWSWLKPPRRPPVLVSAFGDMFFKSADAVIMLDTLEGAITRVARSGIELRERLASEDGRDELLSDLWVQAAQRQGLQLSEGECFDWAVSPALGGPLSADNITKMSFVVKVDLAGQLHRQIKALPPGTKINRVTIDDGS